LRLRIRQTEKNKNVSCKARQARKVIPLKRYWEKTHRKEIFLEKKEEEQNKIASHGRSSQSAPIQKKQSFQELARNTKAKKLANPAAANFQNKNKMPIPPE